MLNHYFDKFFLSLAIKEKQQEASENVNHVVAEGSTVNEVKSTAEVGDCGPTEQEHGTELGHLVAEAKEVKPKDSSSLWSTENVPESTAEDGSSLHKQGKQSSSLLPPPLPSPKTSSQLLWCFCCS